VNLTSKSGIREAKGNGGGGQDDSHRSSIVEHSSGDKKRRATTGCKEKLGRGEAPKRELKLLRKKLPGHTLLPIYANKKWPSKEENRKERYQTVADKKLEYQG